MERSRARVLLEQMELAGQDLLVGLPEEEAQALRQKEREAAGRVSSLEKQLEVLAIRKDLSEEEKTREWERLEGELTRARIDYWRVRGEIRAVSPVYRLALERKREPVALEEVVAWAGREQALVLEYFIGEEASCVMVIRADGGVRVEKLEVGEEEAAALRLETGELTRERLQRVLRGGEGENKAEGLLERLSRADRPEKSEQLAGALHALWRVLIPEGERRELEEGRYRRLVVVPDGVLALLPFEVLVIDLVRPLRYLMDVGPAVLYAPSCTVLLQLERREGQSQVEAKQPVLLVGDCVYGRGAGGRGRGGAFGGAGEVQARRGAVGAAGVLWVGVGVGQWGTSIRWLAGSVVASATGDGEERAGERGGAAGGAFCLPRVGGRKVGEPVWLFGTYAWGPGRWAAG